VIGEVALAMVALVGAGLFVRSFRNIRAIHRGSMRPMFCLGDFSTEGGELYGGADRAVLGAAEGADARPKNSGVGEKTVSYTNFRGR